MTTPTREQVETIVKKALRNLCWHETIDNADTFRTLEFDELDIIESLIDIEDDLHLGYNLDENIFTFESTVEELINEVCRILALPSETA